MTSGLDRAVDAALLTDDGPVGRRARWRSVLRTLAVRPGFVAALLLVLFVVAALVAGGLTMGGVTWVYFLDKWRDDPRERSGGASQESRPASPFDRAL